MIPAAPAAPEPKTVDEQIALAFPAARVDYRRAVHWLILATLAVATIVLLGWTFHVETMKRIVTGLTSMNPVTALCFELCAASLWLMRRQRPAGERGRWAQLLPLPVLYVGVAKITDLSLGTTLCPDALLFTSQLNYGQVYPSRMAPNVAACFVLLSLALLIVDRPRLLRLVHPQWIAAPILCAALSALIGYAYDSSGFYKFKQYIPMALHTAVCFLMMCSALILSRPDEGYLKLIPRRSPGSLSYAKQLPACVLIPAVLGALALLGTDRGWFEGRGTGTAVATVLTILGLSILAFFNAVALNRTESVQRLSEARLRELVGALDERNQALQLEIAERKRMEARAEHMATHDALTGLPNRLLFLDRLEKTISRTLRSGHACALFYIDIDNFKPVNDRHGHQAGDALLMQLGERLITTLREVDTVARLGGDEFAAIMDAPASSEHAQALALRLSAAVSAPCVLELPGQLPITVQVGASIGVALFPGDAKDLDALVRVADSAMYEAKRDGKRRGRAINIRLAASPLRSAA